jgi:predicted Fe-Mo cluster-binding NifX family protein
MKVGFPVINKKIAATFDFASRLLIVTYRNKNILDKTVVELNEPLPSLRAARMKQLQINTLVCGAISNPLATMIWHLNINIISGISGEVDIVLKEFLHDSNGLLHYTLPGFTGRHWKGCCRRKQNRIKRYKY